MSVRVLQDAYERYRGVEDGKVADYIPALAEASPDLFGICVAGVRGHVFAVGDVDTHFSIQSVSKPFVFALVCQAIGHELAREKLGVNSTGLPFDSVMAVELNDRTHDEPDGERRCDRDHEPRPRRRPLRRSGYTSSEGLSRFAGRSLELDDGGLRVGVGDEPEEPGHRAPARRLRPALLRSRSARRTSTPVNAR